MDTIIEYINFTGLGLYLLSSLLFLFLFIRTLRTKDGIGLLFLRILTLSLFVGSLSVAVSRYLITTNVIGSDMGRAIAVINPITLLLAGLYLNYLFHHPGGIIKKEDRERIAQTNKNVKIIKEDVKRIKDQI